MKKDLLCGKSIRWKKCKINKCNILWVFLFWFYEEKVFEEVVEDGISMFIGNWVWVFLCVVIVMIVVYYLVNYVFILWVVSDWLLN